MEDETIRKIEAFTDNMEFERLCSDLLARLGYRGIEPQGVGRKDGGKDAILTSDFGKKFVFHYSMRQDWNKKLSEDLASVKKNALDCDIVVFVSNRFINAGQKDKAKEQCKTDYGWELDIFDNERLRVELDANSKDFREKYLGIPTDSSTPRKIDEIHRVVTQSRKKISFEMINKVAQAIISMKSSDEVYTNNKIPINIKEKINLNDLSQKFEDILKISMTKFADIEDYLKSGLLKTPEIHTLLLTIKTVYLESKNNGRNGDEIFMLMIDKIIPESCNDEEYQAYTILICYFFHTCEVFESVNTE